MKKIIGVVLIIGGLLFAALAIKALFSAPKAEEQIRSAVTIKDGRILPENEGKLVVVSGTLKPAEQLRDPITGVKLPGVTAKRTVWTYERDTNSDDEQVWDWKPEATDYSEISESMPKYLRQPSLPRLHCSVSLMWRASCLIRL